MQRFKVKASTRQLQVALLVYAYPNMTYRELARLLDVSTNEAARAVSRLERLGIVQYRHGLARVNRSVLENVQPYERNRQHKPLPDETRRLLEPIIAELSSRSRSSSS